MARIVETSVVRDTPDVTDSLDVIQVRCADHRYIAIEEMAAVTRHAKSFDLTGVSARNTYGYDFV
jgi:hypothetical protein